MNDLKTMYDRIAEKETSVAVIGIGHIGLSVALEFSKYYNVIAFDVSKERIERLRRVYSDWKGSLTLTDSAETLAQASCYIVVVGTPLDGQMRPDLTQLTAATRMVGSYLRRGDYVVYESTVYPGCTESECVPLLEKTSGLVCGEDFKVGYSPERINPLDSSHAFCNTAKIVSGIDKQTTDELVKIYRRAIRAEVHPASSIKVAEAAKIVENVQRGVNIALVNEISRLFSRMDIDLQQVLDMASTKWNFADYRPGLLGGPCIPVNPYYLLSEAMRVGVDMPLVKQSCAVNDRMAEYVVSSLLGKIDRRERPALRALIMGITYKDDSDDIRNKAVVDMYRALSREGVQVDITDPHADAKAVRDVYGIPLADAPCPPYDMIIVTVGHAEYKHLDEAYFLSIAAGDHAVLADLKGLFRGRINTLKYWSL